MLCNVVTQCTEEACGLIGGMNNKAIKIYPITNSLHSPTGFRMDAAEQVKAMSEIERNGWELLAIYHSHLRGPEYPSVTDTAEFAYPGVAYLIFDLSGTSPAIHGFQMVDGEWTENPVVIDE